LCSEEVELVPDAEVDGRRIYMFKGAEGRGTYHNTHHIRNSSKLFLKANFTCTNLKHQLRMFYGFFSFH
jgi:hypothetical protein